LDYVVLKGETERTEVWDHLDDQRKRTFRRADGAQLAISVVVVDSGYLQETVFKYTKPREKYRVYAVKGDTGLGKPLVGKYTLLGPRKNVRCYLLGVNRGKDKLYNRLRFEEPAPGESREGFCHFPKKYPPSYVIGLLSEEKQRDKKDPRKFRYVKIHEGSPNEPLDLKIYNMAAVGIANPNFPVLEQRLRRMAEMTNNDLPVEPLITTRRRRVRSKGI
jgi:phage terminase large subunit GpA-like protein